MWMALDNNKTQLYQPVGHVAEMSFQSDIGCCFKTP